jgi:hypothetical protein
LQRIYTKTTPILIFQFIAVVKQYATSSYLYPVVLSGILWQDQLPLQMFCIVLWRKGKFLGICSLISAILFSSVSGKGNKKEKYF